MRILHGERQRSPGLVAVQRAVAGIVEPQRALALPVRQRVRRLAGAAAFVAGAARPVILRRGSAEIGAEAKALIGQRDGAVRIVFARRDGIAEARDEDVAHHDFGCDALRRVGAGGDVDARGRWLAIAGAQIDRLVAVERLLPRRPVAIVEGPGAGRADRDRTAQPHRDRMLRRRQVAFADVVATAGLVDATGEIDAEPVDHVARPAAAVALRLELLFGGQHAPGPHALGMQQKIPLLAKQPKTVAHFP